MAGDWIKMRTELDEDPAVIQIAAELELDELDVIGRLWKLWSWANSQSRDGDAPGVTVAWLDRQVRVTGFGHALKNAGWLVEKKHGISIPKFDAHNSKPAKRRALTAARMSRSRDARRRTKCAPEKRREEKSKEPGGEGVLDRLKNEDLKHKERVLRAHDAAAELGWFKASDFTRSAAPGLAQACLREADQPARAFKWRMKSGKWNWQTDGDEEEARKS